VEQLATTSRGTALKPPRKPGRLRPLNVVQAAINQVGGVEQGARLLGASERSIYLWMKRGDMRGVAAELVLRLAAESGISAENLVGEVKRARKRPLSDNNGQ
jgi:hypothetical protein